MQQTAIISLHQLADDHCYEFVLATTNPPTPGFLIRHQGKIHAYINRCPHTGASLNWQPNQFLDNSGRLIQCGIHGARFQIEDGYCLHGPCLGQSLQALKVTIEQSKVYVSL